MRVATLLLLCFFIIPSSKGFGQFHHKASYIGPSLIFATNPLGFVAQFEHAITPEIGLGGLLRYWSQSRKAESWSVIMPMVQAAYHFKTEVPELDPFAGIRLGFASFTYESNVGTTKPFDNSLYLTAMGGARYFLTPTIGCLGSVEVRLAGDDYLKSALGVMIGADFIF